MTIQKALLLKSSIWEVFSAILGFAVVYLVTGQLEEAGVITLVLLVLKSILLAIYDYYATKIIDKLR